MDQTLGGNVNDKIPDFDLNEEYNCEDKNGDEIENEDCYVDPKLQEISVDEVNALTFKTDDEAYDFYLSYSKAKGFGVRKSSLQRRKGDTKIRLRIFVCSREGDRSKKDKDDVNRKREPKGETRVGCGAHLRIRYDRKKDLYVVASFENEHNHTLTPRDRVKFLRSHRSISSSDMAEARAMRNVGISSSKIMDYMVEKYKGYENCGFIQKDLSNALDIEYREDMLDGDAEAALVYLSAKNDSDPLYYYKYKLDDENRLEMLFWADSKSRNDYAHFGEVLAFDTTYRTNMYNKPFVMLVGVNNHYQTVMFGCALLPNELESTYLWVLETFLDAMKGKKPSAVVTDSDRAMRSAIVSVFPGAVHRLCKWHIQKNVTTNIHIKGFIDDFTDLMDDPCTPEEFEAGWTRLLEKYELGNNSWLPKLYNNRKLWATSYLKGKFFANMRTTGRCEGFNGYFNAYLNKKLRIFKFVRLFDKALLKIRHREASENHNTEETRPVLSTKLYDIERHAFEVFTRKIFFKVRTQIELTMQIFDVQSLCNDDGEWVYYMSMYKKSDSTWIVRYNPRKLDMRCSCLFFESIGLPCSHMFQVMKILGMKEIPECLIMERWTRNAKPIIPSFESINLSSADEQVARYGSLTSRCNKMSYFASHTAFGWKVASNEIDNLMGRMEELYIASIQEGNKGDGLKRNFGIRDPTFVNTKGNPGTKKAMSTRRCTLCRRTGHFKNTCPQLGSLSVETSTQYDKYSNEGVSQEIEMDEYTMCAASNMVNSPTQITDAFHFHPQGFMASQDLEHPRSFHPNPNQASSSVFSQSSWDQSDVGDIRNNSMGFY